jgi:heterodisulfide reductase subunit C2
MSTVVNPRLAEQVGTDAEFNASACMNCGVCTAVCPMGIEVLPRRLFRYVMLGMEDQVTEETESIYSCLLCRMCEVNCPAGVNIAENVRSLRRHINRTAFGLRG